MIMTESHKNRYRICLVGPTAGKTYTLNTLNPTNKAFKTQKTILPQHHFFTIHSSIFDLWDCPSNRSCDCLTNLHSSLSDITLLFYNPYKKDSSQLLQKWYSILELTDNKRLFAIRTLRSDWSNPWKDDGRIWCQERGITHYEIDSGKPEMFQKILEDAGEWLAKQEPKINDDDKNKLGEDANEEEGGDLGDKKSSQLSFQKSTSRSLPQPMKTKYIQYIHKIENGEESNTTFKEEIRQWIYESKQNKKQEIDEKPKKPAKVFDNTILVISLVVLAGFYLLKKAKSIPGVSTS